MDRYASQKMQGVLGSAPVAMQEAGMRMPQVRSETERLHRRLADLSEVVEKLEQRLEGVLQSHPPETCGLANAPKEVLVPAADEIRNAHERVGGLSLRLESILGRLEV